MEGLEAFWGSIEGPARRLIELARDEDLGGSGAPPSGHAPGDITTRACGIAERPAAARLVAREAAIIAGVRAVPLLLEVFSAERTRVEALAADGDHAEAGATILRLAGPLGEILRIERTLLNLLSRLCGIATLTGRFVEAARGSRAGIFDTRKTTPGLRGPEKYAVRCGGGRSHRMGLWDAVLIKDNHLAQVPVASLERWLVEAAARARAERPGVFVEVEVDREDQLEAALTSGAADAVLLDNMAPPRLRSCVRRRDALAPGVLLEASGGITLANIAEVARTGVDRVSIGALTHHAVGIDLALDIGP